MDSSHITGMLRALNPVLRNRRKAQALLERYWHERMALVWTTQDVHRAANERGVALSRAEAIQILQNLHERHNRQLGLRWNDLIQIIADGVLGRPLTKSELDQFVHQDVLTIQKPGSRKVGKRR